MTTNLKAQWLTLRDAALQPLTLLFMGGTILLSLASYHESTKPAELRNDALVVVLTAFIAVASGIVGSRLEKVYQQRADESLTAVRGRIAIRSLNLLLHFIASFQRTFSLHISQNIADVRVSSTLHVYLGEECRSSKRRSSSPSKTGLTLYRT